VKRDPHFASELSRDLTLFHIVMMGLGMMIGAGVFLGIGHTIAEAGPGGVLLTFALNGVIALLSAMSYAELSSAIPRAGGAYNFARIAFGRGTSFLAGWMEWFASSVAGSVYALTFSIYTLRYLEQLGLFESLPLDQRLAVKVVAAAVACFFVYINYRGASETGKVGAFFTLGQTLFMVFIGAVGVVVAFRDPARLLNFKPFLPQGWSRLLVTMGFTYVAFEGFEVIAQAGDETIEPKSNLPKAMLYSVFIVTITYVTVGFATVVAVNLSASDTGGLLGQFVEEHAAKGHGTVLMHWMRHHHERGFGEAVSRLMPYGNFFLTLAVIFASTSALNATVFSATRASYALGRDRMLPGVFARISHKRKTPWVALLGTGVIVLIVATALPTRDVASSASIMFLFLFFLVNICVIRIRLNMGDELSYGFLMPFFPVLPLLAVVCQAVLAVWLVHMSRIAWIIAPCWIAVGLLIYRFYSRSRAVATSDEIQVLEEETAPVQAGYRIMVAVANPDNALSLVRNTYKLREAKQAAVELLHMVPVPDQVALGDAEQYMSDGREGIGEVMLYLGADAPVSRTLRYCRNVGRGIVSAVKEKRVDLLIMGWHGLPQDYGFRLGSTIDPVIQRTPCDVAVFKECGDRKFKRALVPIAGGPHAALALEIASILVADEAGEIVAFSVRTDGEPFDIDAFVAEQTDRLRLPADRVSTKTVDSAQVLAAIKAEAQDYDLIVLGYTGDPLIYRATRQSLPEAVARACDQPLVMVKASGGFQSWLKRWL